MQLKKWLSLKKNIKKKKKNLAEKKKTLSISVFFKYSFKRGYKLTVA